MTRQTGRLFIVYDNYTLKKELIPAWGFSLLVQYPQYITLFDAGGDAAILNKNITQMGIDIKKIDSLVLSHAHGDHAGGLQAILQFKNDIKVFISESFPQKFKEDVSLTGVDVINISKPFDIHPGIHTTGKLGRGLNEQSLVIETVKGLVIITGCAHPGILEIVEHSQKQFDGSVYLLIGGFHLMEYSSKELSSIGKKLEEMNVQMIAPCHCSGDTTREVFKNHFGKNYIQCAVGTEIELPELAGT